MARHSIGFTAAGASVFRNVRKTTGGRALLLLDEDDIVDLELDFTRYLEDGESVSSLTATGRGVTVSATLASPKATLTLSKAGRDGEVDVVATFSSGRAWSDRVLVRNPQRYGEEADRLDYCRW